MTHVCVASEDVLAGRVWQCSRVASVHACWWVRKDTHAGVGAAPVLCQTALKVRCFAAALLHGFTNPAMLGDGIRCSQLQCVALHFKCMTNRWLQFLPGEVINNSCG